MSTVVENGKDVRRFSKSFKEGKNLPTQKTLKELSSFEKQLIKESLHEYGEVTLEESTYSELTGYSYRRTTYKVEDKIDQGEEGSLEWRIEKTSLTKGELVKKISQAIFISSIGGTITAVTFDYKVGVGVGLISACANIYGIFYRNKRYSEYY